MALDFKARMLNSWSFSHCNNPCLPITSSRTEVIEVDLSGDVITVSSALRVAGGRRRIYAARAIETDNSAIFVILAELPPLFVDTAFFPAAGTVVVFPPVGSEQRRLYAVGTDFNSGACRGWIFNAVELLSSNRP